METLNRELDIAQVLKKASSYQPQDLRSAIVIVFKKDGQCEMGNSGEIRDLTFAASFIEAHVHRAFNLDGRKSKQSDSRPGRKRKKTVKNA